MSLPASIAGTERIHLPVSRLGIEVPGSAPALSLVAQSIDDVAQYLKTRRPCPDPHEEMPLFATLPEEIQHEVRDLLIAFHRIAQAPSSRKGSEQVAASILGQRHGWSAERLRKRYDTYRDQGDWLCLVNRSKVCREWRDGGNAGLPREFIRFASERFAMFRRKNGATAAIRSIRHQWESGRDRKGQPAPIPGYGFWRDWFARTYPGVPLPPTAPFPKGWSADNIRRQARLNPAVRALCHEGIAAARKFMPGVLRTRVGLRFLELVEFDDVKTDWRVFDPATGEVMDLWLLIARDRSTNLLLGFGMRPARVRDDGTQEHLRLQDMKQLAGWILERYGVPTGYVSTWQLENATATLPAAARAAIEGLTNHAVRISLSGMITGNAPSGYAEKAKGNSNGKASLESSNRILHTDGSDLPGQTGTRYELRPADLVAREKEAVREWQLLSRLPEHLRSRGRFALLSLGQARENLFRIFNEENRRTDHELEGFDVVVEWRPDMSSAWASQATVPEVLPPGAEIRERKESPMERATRLTQGCKFRRVSPVVLRAFFEHTLRLVTVDQRGEIQFTADKRSFVFADPAGAGPDGVAPGTKFLAFFHPEDPALVHLLNPKTVAYVATWVRRGRVAFGDTDGVAAALRYTRAGLKAQQEEAARLLSPERQEHEDRRAHNAALVAQAEDFIDVAPMTDGLSGAGLRQPGSVAALDAIAQTRSGERTAARDQVRLDARMEDDAESALDALMPD